MRTQEDFSFHSILEVVEDLKQGKMIILVDDEDRENEGDLVAPADKITPDIINFMASYGKGLICLPMNDLDIKRLNLNPMISENTSARGTAFTVSIEAKEGVTTGISAFDRSHTIKTAVNPDTKADDLARPGHVFPLRASDGGVLVRPGQTEGSVELCELAGLSKNAVICEIMDDDGTMARLPKLFEFAEKHKLKICTIKDLIIYKIKNENILRKVKTSKINLQNGIQSELNLYKCSLAGEWYISVSYGNIKENEVIPAYLHKQSIITDVLDILISGGKNKGIIDFVESSITEDKGIMIFLCNQTKTEMEAELSFMHNEKSTYSSKADEYLFKDLRNIGITSLILKDNGVNNIEIRKNNLDTINELSKFDINVKYFKKLNK